MWWASAGEQRLHSEEESDFDASLLLGLTLPRGPPKTPVSAVHRSHSTPSVRGEMFTSRSANAEMAIVAYFHRLTTQFLSVISDLVDASDSDDEREEEHALVHTEEQEENIGSAVYVSSADVARMGLDVWSSNDHLFIEEVARDYFGRRARVEGRNVDICGVRIC